MNKTIEEAAKDYAYDMGDSDWERMRLHDAFIDGINHIMQLPLCDRLTPEEKERVRSGINGIKRSDMRGYIIGIDPGALGGIAVLDGTSGNLLECQKMPATPQDILTALGSWNTDDMVCFIEKVGFGMPGQSSKATATFARHCGQLEMALLAKGISTVEVTPAKWQKHFNLSGKKGESKTSHKNRIKAWSQQRFPKQKVTLWAADALAIASYGFEMRK